MAKDAFSAKSFFDRLLRASPEDREKIATETIEAFITSAPEEFQAGLRSLQKEIDERRATGQGEETLIFLREKAKELFGSQGGGNKRIAKAACSAFGAARVCLRRQE